MKRVDALFHLLCEGRVSGVLAQRQKSWNIIHEWCNKTNVLRKRREEDGTFENSHC